VNATAVGKISMYRVDVLLTDAGEPQEIPAALVSELSQDDAARAARFHQPRDRWLFLLGRSLLRYGVRERFGIEHARLALSANGKPHLEPRQGIEFNLSHTRGWITCAFGRDCDIGIDVERLDRVIDGPGIAQAFFAPSEQAIIEGASPSQRSDMFLRLWTLKEAVLKAVSIGLSLELDRFAIALDPPRLDVLVPELGDPRAWQFHEWCLPQACRLALAIRRPDERPIAVSLVHVPLAALVGLPTEAAR
jgi:4'-phosphopantetheinyl transferase